MDTSPEATPLWVGRWFRGDVGFLCCVVVGFGPGLREKYKKNPIMTEGFPSPVDYE